MIKPMWKSFVIAALIAFTFSWTQCQSSETDQKDWFKSFEEASSYAQKASKPILALYYTNTCKYCNLLMNNTIPNAEVKHYLNYFSLAMVNTKEHQDTFRKYAPGVNGIPYIGVYDSKQQPVDNIHGYRNTEDMVRELKRILTKMNINFETYTASANAADKTQASSTLASPKDRLASDSQTPKGATNPANAQNANNLGDDTSAMRARNDSKNESANAGAEPGNKAEIRYLTSYDKCLSAANKESKKVMINFYTNSCPWCKRLDQMTFTDETVKKTMDSSYVLCKINTQEDSATAMKYGANGVPTTVLVDAAGKELDRISGFRQPTDFLKDIDDIEKKKSNFFKMKDSYEKNKQDYKSAKSFLSFLVQRGRTLDAIDIHKEMIGGIHGSNEEFKEYSLMFYMQIVSTGGAEYALPHLKNVCSNDPKNKYHFEACMSHAIALYFTKKENEAIEKLKSMQTEYSNDPEKNQQIGSTLNTIQQMMKNQSI